MERSFRFSVPVTGWIVLLAIAAGVVALRAPSIAIPLAVAGGLATAAIWFKVAYRTKKWAWWDFGVVPLRPVEGIIGVSGVVLFAAGFLAIVPVMRNAT